MKTPSTWDKTYKSLVVGIGGSMMSSLDVTVAKKDEGDIYSRILFYSQTDSSVARLDLCGVTPQEMRAIAANLCEQALYLEHLQSEGGAA